MSSQNNNTTPLTEQIGQATSQAYETANEAFKSSYHEPENKQKTEDKENYPTYNPAKQSEYTYKDAKAVIDEVRPPTGSKDQMGEKIEQIKEYDIEKKQAADMINRQAKLQKDNANDQVPQSPTDPNKHEGQMDRGDLRIKSPNLDRPTKAEQAFNIRSDAEAMSSANGKTQ